MIDFTKIVGFDWDAGDIRKNDKHGVMSAEAEQVFLDPALGILEDVQHSNGEIRYLAYGATGSRRLLAVAFTLRANATLIRVISARDMNRRERKTYESQN